MQYEELPSTLFHVTDARSWPSIQRHGLLTTASILRRWEVDPETANGYLTQIRRQPVGPIEHPEMGTAWIRDQRNMTEKGLAKALDDATSPADWCLMLNRQVFFYPTHDRAQKLVQAYREHAQVVLALRTMTLIESYGSLVRLARINSGRTAHSGVRRGPESFARVGFFNGTSSTISEVVVQADIDDLDDHLTAVWLHEPDAPRKRLALA